MAVVLEAPEQALRHYSKYFGKYANKDELGFDRKSLPWNRQEVAATGNEISDQSLEQDTAFPSHQVSEVVLTSLTEVRQEGNDNTEPLCQQCQLPLGEVRYRRHTCGSAGKDIMHAECMAQVMARKRCVEEDAHLQDEIEERMKQRREYGIGWEVCQIPGNKAPASKLAMQDIPQGMVCLVLDSQAQSIRLAATAVPVAAVNLDYLSTAFEVRRREGHEPIFSLEPTDPNDLNCMQQKVFMPEWLAGTSAGEVLFQADYHLKELSMGQCKQPVVGMKSCLDFEADSSDWRAREWYLVRKAEVQIAENDVLIPSVKMGVEAREQEILGNGLEDKPITEPDHPMARYAQAFTRNFDLIAERKSVIYHLRELAKASVIAKFLLDADAELDESWFHLFEEKDIACSLEVPQLWNRRQNSQIQVQRNGINTEKRTHSVFGGVQFGLDKINLRPSISRTAPQPSEQIALGAGLTAAPLQTSVARLGQIARPMARPITAMSLDSMPSAAIELPSGLKAMALPTTGAPITLGGVRAGELQIPKQRLQFGLARGMTIPVTKVAADSYKYDAGRIPDLPAWQDALQATIPGAAPKGLMPSKRLSALGLASMQQALSTVPSMKGDVRLQGVDLRLDNFDLSSAARVSLAQEVGAWGAETKQLSECVSFGDAFWHDLDSDTGVLNQDDCSLLKDVFNPQLADRRMEGNYFVPPDSRHSYVTKLRLLVVEEEAVRQRRKDHFCSKAFLANRPVLVGGLGTNIM
jgi:hypothetical protein